VTKFPYRLDRTVVVHAAPDVVFRFFTDSERWASWWGAGSTIDARPGGRVFIRHPDGLDVLGEVTGIHHPERIAFSYGFTSDTLQPSGGSRVTIRLEPIGSTTRLHLAHEFVDAAARDEHVQGWRFQLSVFGNVVANEIHADVASVIDGWFQAWSIADTMARKDAFARVTSPDVGLRDRFSLIDGLDDLVAHTGAYQVFFPGIHLERRGDVRHCQGVALADWISLATSGSRMAGTCCFSLNTANRIETVINFITPSTDSDKGSSR
jgi:uncharacterized protein YndB with AHSA1/START domain